MEQEQNKNVALWIFPNFRETINSLPAKYRGRAWEVLIEKAYGNSIELQKEKIFVQCAVNSLLPLVKLRNTGGSKNGESNNPSGRRGTVEEQRTTLAPTLAPTLDKKETNVGATVAPTLLYNNNNNNNSNINNNSKYNINNTSTPFAARDEKVSKPKKKTALQVFCNCVVDNFEEKGSVETDEQKRIWFKRNCRVLSDILNFCEKDIERALFTIDETCKWLDENNLEGGYEAVSRHLPEMHAKALKRINNGEHWNFTKEQKNQIDKLYGKRAENITTEQAENNKKEFAKMIGGLVGGKL